MSTAASQQEVLRKPRVAILKKDGCAFYYLCKRSKFYSIWKKRLKNGTDEGKD